jgi:hypothetical protein
MLSVRVTRNSRSTFRSVPSSGRRVIVRAENEVKVTGGYNENDGTLSSPEPETKKAPKQNADGTYYIDELEVCDLIATSTLTLNLCRFCPGNLSCGKDTLIPNTCGDTQNGTA